MSNFPDELRAIDYPNAQAEDDPQTREDDLEIPAFLDRRKKNQTSATHGEWIEHVKAAWRKGLEGILETGRLLQLGHDAMPREEFEKIVVSEFGFSTSVARKLMIIARDERIANCANSHKFPRAWNTLYELSKLPDDTFNRMLTEGSIHPGLTLPDAVNAVSLEKVRRGARLKKSLKKINRPSPTGKSAKQAPPRPQPIDEATAKDLIDFLTLVVTRMRAAPSNIGACAKFLMPEERRELAVVASEAITWLSSIYDAAQPK